MEFPTKFTRTDAEQSWPQFVRWIGYANLASALKRKHASLNEWQTFREIAPRLFSIELGLAKVLQRWRATHRLSFPKEKDAYDALAFAGLCIAIKKQLSAERAEAFRRRVISEILPSGRLCHLDHEFRVGQNLSEHGWQITHYGIAGEPGPDFIAKRENQEIEVEGKCLSPEIGLGVSYEYATRLLNRINRTLREKKSGKLTTIKIEVMGGAFKDNQIDLVKDRVIDCYNGAKNYRSENLAIELHTSSLLDFLNRFPNVEEDGWLEKTFSEIRTREGDYGYFIRRDNELVFCNLIPMRPNRQAKTLFKLVSDTCERQFTLSRPAILWLHLQGLDPKRVDMDLNSTPEIFERLADHAFRSERRNHLAAITFSSDSDINIGHLPTSKKSARVVSSVGKVRGFDNPRCRFGQVPAFSPMYRRHTDF